VNHARRDLCGGCSAMGIPTAIGQNFRGELVYIRVDWTYAGQILDPHQGCPGGRATEAQALSLLQARGLTYNFSQMEE